MSLNFGKISDELVFDLINRDNPDLPIPVSSSNCIVEKLTQVSANGSNNFRNTKARLRGQQGTGFRDAITLYYDRVHINNSLPWGGGLGSSVRDNTAMTSFTAANLHELLPVFFDTYGVNLSPKDVQNVTFGGVGSPNYSFAFNLNILATCPAYYGSTTPRLNRGLPVLDTSIVSDRLNGITHPIDPTKEQMCVDLMTWGIDFTAYKNLLTVTSAGLPNWDGLRNLLDSLGVPTYGAPLNSNTVQDVATSTNQWASKDFDRVVIQTGIDETGAKGVAYYHYNN